MRVRLTVERELEPFWGAEDLLEERGGIVSEDFCKQLLQFTYMEDIDSFLHPNDEEKYEPVIKLEVVDSHSPLITDSPLWDGRYVNISGDNMSGVEQFSAITQYIKDLKSTIPIDPDEVVVSDYARGCLHTTKHVIAMLCKILKEQESAIETKNHDH